MKLPRTGRALVAGMAVAAALTMTACSSGEDGGTTDATTSAATTSSAVAEAPSDLPPVPTAEELNTRLQESLDPNVPLEQKVQYVQGAEADPELINKVAEAARVNNAKIQVLDVTDLGDGTLSSNATIDLGGQVNPLQVAYIAEDGEWKLSKDNACAIVSLAQLTSPACTA
ncbi:MULTISPECIES: hypothetical protein [Nocardiaceae]|uniref:Osmotically-inducible protein OsmY n=1 Tax=Rhodococcoides corynebacterioides TaxID=53972 RepID=A0ABS2KT88_9NOCA|nr:MULTISPECIES: hypothetical protein [Rhodococcus]MBM7415113.1 osmotically-inducible protein OsmY [Rhodococcus corynebacterioides]MBP1117575.1 osmotically-inducible protein OsmY [Rhodococcus sp. PvP016]